jgi:site-specific DNA recombinase
MKKAAVYMRVSTAHQEEEQTIENQSMEIRQRIKDDENLLLPECVYKDEGWSGAIIERPSLDQMRADARESKFEVLYVYDRGRLSRKFVHQEIILDELRECGIDFISLHDINGQSTEEVLMGSVMGIFHEYERVKITERMRIGKVRKVRENKKLLGYQPKFGYDYFPRIKTGPNTRDGYFEVNEDQAKVVRQIFEWLADGMSKHEIKRQLFKMGIPPPKGKREQWSGGTLDRMATDTTYMGMHYYNKSESVPTKNPRNPEQKYRKVSKGSRKRRPKEEWFLVIVPAIVSPELFDRVQVQLAKHKRINTRNNKKNSYLVAGIVECVCGKARTGDPANKGNLYYRCTDRLSKFPLPRECFEQGINAPVLDALVWRSIKSLLTDPQLVVDQAERWQKAASPLENQLEILKKRLKALDQEERRYTKAFGQGMMSERLYKDNFHETNTKRADISAEISSIQAELVNKPVIPPEKLIDGVLKLVGNLDFTDQKSIVQKLVTKIIATKKEVTIWGLIPIPASDQVGKHDEHRNSYFANHLANEGKVGLNAQYWHSRVAQCWQIYFI